MTRSHAVGRRFPFSCLGMTALIRGLFLRQFPGSGLKVAAERPERRDS
jgi:hypothetical protein